MICHICYGTGRRLISDDVIEVCPRCTGDGRIADPLDLQARRETLREYEREKDGE